MLLSTKNLLLSVLVSSQVYFTLDYAKNVFGKLRCWIFLNPAVQSTCLDI